MKILGNVDIYESELFDFNEFYISHSSVMQPDLFKWVLF
jgi:hypothetical protein